MRRLTGLIKNLIPEADRQAFLRSSGQGKDDDRRVQELAKQARGEDFANTTMLESMGASYMPGYRLREAVNNMGDSPLKSAAQLVVGKPEANYVEGRRVLDMDTSREGLVGDALGTVVNDLSSNRSRNYWWLLNAVQATTDVIGDSLNRRAAPAVFGSSLLRKADGRVFSYDPDTPSTMRAAYENGWLKDSETLGERIPGRGIFIQNTNRNPEALTQLEEDLLRSSGKLKKDESLTPEIRKALDSDTVEWLGERTKNAKSLLRRNHEPGHVNLLTLPAQIAINSGVGLMTPTGGYEGYQAVFPEEDNLSKSNNPIAEVGAKYILGRTGNIFFLGTSSRRSALMSARVST